MTIRNWSLFDFFKKKKDNSIIFFPNPKDVFVNPEMKVYFTPLLTYIHKTDSREYRIHILTSAGLICENSYLNSENRFFGFKYIDGKYDFLGNINTFGSSNIKEVFNFLNDDFNRNKDYYLDKKISLNDYIKMIKPLAQQRARFTENQSLDFYMENFYSGELEKYNYEKTKKLKHIFEITEAVFPNENQYFYDSRETENILKEFYENLSSYFKNRYNFDKLKPVCAVDTYKFTNFSSTSVAFLNVEKNIVYMLEYNKK